VTGEKKILCAECGNPLTKFEIGLSAKYPVSKYTDMCSECIKLKAGLL
jgi:hypothetical protein